MLETTPPTTDPLDSAALVYLATAGLLVGMALLGMAVAAGLARVGDTDPLRLFLSAAGVSVLWIGGVTFGLAALPPKSVVARLGLAPARLSRRGWLAAILGGLALSQAIDFLLQLSGVGRGPALGGMIDALESARGLGLALAVLIVGVGAGTVEELFFRGFAQRRLATQRSRRSS